jgi:hypothetical protein
VERRHHRAAQRGDEVDGEAVHRDVQAAIADAEDHKRQPESGRRPGQRREQQSGRQRRAARERHRPAAEPPAQDAGDRHGRHGTAGRAEQREAQGCRGRCGLFLHGGDPHRPTGEDEPVNGEECSRGPPDYGKIDARGTGALYFV